MAEYFDQVNPSTTHRIAAIAINQLDRIAIACVGQ